MQLSEKQFCADWVARMGELTPLTTANVLQYLNLRAQADARPVGHFFKASRVHPWVQVEKECPNAVPLYTHPEASAPGMSDDEWLALAERHIKADWNSEQPDGYLNAVKALAQDAMLLTRASAATVGEQSEPWREKLIELADQLDAELTTGVQWSNAQFACFYVSDDLRKIVKKAGGVPNEKDWKTRALEAEKLNRQFMERWNAENGPTHMGEPVIAAQQQAEPGADERAAFEAWQSVDLPSHQRSSYTAADVEFNCYEAALAAWLERAKRANSRENSAPLHLGACITDGKLYVTAMQSGPNHTTTVVATAELDMGALLKDDCHAVMTAAQSGQRAGVAECKWSPDSDFEGDTWDSACGEKWSFIDGGPAENRVRFCQGCGGRVVIAAPTQQQEGGK